MYSLPQEIEVWYIIPAIRKEFSKVLTKKHKLTLEKAGGLLGVSKAAVSQYLRKKRAGLVKIPSNIKKEIEISADKIVRNEEHAIEEINRILKLMKDTKCSCGVCKKYNKGVLKLCKEKPTKWE